MNKGVVLLLVLLLTASSLTVLKPVRAESRKIVVPDDYSTIVEAIDKAADGDTVLVKKGIYEGAQNQTMFINKTISLMGEDAASTTINLHPPLVPMYIFTYEYMGYLNSISIDAQGVKISDFTINTPGGNIAINSDKVTLSHNNITTGVSVNGAESQIIGNTIWGGISLGGTNQTIAQNIVKGEISVNGRYTVVADNTLSGGWDVITISSNNNLILNNTILDNEGAGIDLKYNVSENTIAKNDLTHSYILLETRCSLNNVYGNKFYSIGLMGFSNVFTANRIVHVNIGGFHGGSIDAANNNFYHNNFVGSAPEFTVFTKEPGPLILDGNFWNGNMGIAPYDVYGDYHYFDGAVREDTTVYLGQDHSPLQSPFDISSIDVKLPAWASYFSTLIAPPQITALSLENQTLTGSVISLLFKLNKAVDWMGYSLDGSDNVTVAGNTTLTGLASGLHNLTVYAKDEFGNTGASETVIFNVAEEPFPVVPLAAASVAAIAVVSVGLLVYFKKRKH
jgi:parallel beta-helix repeat protein